MSVLMFTPLGDRYSESVALIAALTQWLDSQPRQRVRPSKVEFVENDDGSLSGITVVEAEPLRLVK